MKQKLSIVIIVFFTIFSYSQNELEIAAEKLEKQKKEQQKVVNEKPDNLQSEIKEPEWVGQVVYVDNGKTTELESQKAYYKANSSVSTFIIGVGKRTMKHMVNGNKSSLRVKSNNNIKFIVKTHTNVLNPKSIIKIVRLLTDKKNKRYYIGTTSGTFSGSKSGDLDLIKFKAKKFGKSSYEVLISNVGDGEFAIIINNSRDWNLFGVE